MFSTNVRPACSQVYLSTTYKSQTALELIEGATSTCHIGRLDVTSTSAVIQSKRIRLGYLRVLMFRSQQAGMIAGPALRVPPEYFA